MFFKEKEFVMRGKKENEDFITTNPSFSFPS